MIFIKINYRILNNVDNLNLVEKIFLKVFKKYTYKIYSYGFKDGFNHKLWKTNMGKIWEKIKC